MIRGVILNCIKIKKSHIIRQSIRELRRLYGSNVNFCYLGHQPSAIIGVSNNEKYVRPILLEDTKRPEWKVVMDMQLGKPYSPTSIQQYPVVFKHRDKVDSAECVYVYEKVC